MDILGFELDFFQIAKEREEIRHKEAEEALRKKTEALEAAKKKQKDAKPAEPVRAGIGKYLKAPPVKNSSVESPSTSSEPPQVPKKKSKLVMNSGMSDFSSW